jgi:hypothetical protein
VFVTEWRKEEVEHIDATLDGAERKAALCALLEQESQLIASIGRHRIAAGERNYDKAVQAFLEKVKGPLYSLPLLSDMCGVPLILSQSFP